MTYTAFEESILASSAAPPMTVTVDPESTGGNVGNGSQSYGSCTCLTQNAVGSVTYSWTRLAGSSQEILPNSPTLQTTSFGSDGTDEIFSDSFICTATDSRGPVQSSNQVDVGVQHGLPP